MSVSLDNYIGLAVAGPGPGSGNVKYSEKLTHDAGESAGHWKRSQTVAKRLRARAAEYEEHEWPGGVWVAVELRKMAEEIEGS